MYKEDEDTEHVHETNLERSPSSDDQLQRLRELCSLEMDSDSKIANFVDISNIWVHLPGTHLKLHNLRLDILKLFVARAY